MEREEKLKALEVALSKIEKEYGKGSVMKLGDTANHMNVETIPTGSLSLDTWRDPQGKDSRDIRSGIIG